MMNAGDDVVLDDDGGMIAGSGLKSELYWADVATMAFPTPPYIGQDSDPYRPERKATADDVKRVNDAITAMKRDVARRANAYAAAIVSHIATNAQAVITTSTVCGRTPNPNNPNVNIQPPSGDVLLSIQ